jgi:hypothetical protein
MTLPPLLESRLLEVPPDKHALLPEVSIFLSKTNIATTTLVEWSRQRLSIEQHARYSHYAIVNEV